MSEYLYNEKAIEGIYNFIVANLPARIAEINSEVVDGITLTLPIFHSRDLPTKNDGCSLAVSRTGNNYNYPEYGYQTMEMQFDINIIVSGTSIDGVSTIETLTNRWCDAILNLFMKDPTCGSAVTAGYLEKEDHIYDYTESFAFIGFECRALIDVTATN